MEEEEEEEEEVCEGVLPVVAGAWACFEVRAWERVSVWAVGVSKCVCVCVCVCVWMCRGAGGLSWEALVSGGVTAPRQSDDNALSEGRKLGLVRPFTARWQPSNKNSGRREG